MPSTSAKQHRFMAAIAHSPSFAKKVGVSQSVGKDFTAADKGKTFKKGGMMKESKAMVGKEVAFFKKKGAPASMIKHEKAEMMGMKKGGMPMKDGKPMFMKKMNMGGMSSYAKGGGIESRGKTRRFDMGGFMSPIDTIRKSLPGYGGGGGNRGAYGGLDTVKEGEGQTRKSLGAIQSELGGGGNKGDFIPSPQMPIYDQPEYKKGGPISRKKPRRMADGGATSLTMMPEYDKGGKGALGGLDTVRQGEGQTRKSLSNIQSELGGQGGGSGIGDLYKDLYPSASKSSGMTGGVFKKGGSIRGGGIESRGKTKGTMVRMATGGSVSSASRRADGIAQRGKTKFKNC